LSIEHVVEDLFDEVGRVFILNVLRELSQIRVEIDTTEPPNVEIVWWLDMTNRAKCTVDANETPGTWRALGMLWPANMSDVTGTCECLDQRECLA